jgi:hypothetical protein
MAWGASAACVSRGLADGVPLATALSPARKRIWARAADDDVTRIDAAMLENTKPAVNLLRDLDEARRRFSLARVERQAMMLQWFLPRVGR